MKDEDIMKDIMKDLNKIIQKNILKNNDSYLNYNNQITYTDEDIDKIKMKYKDKVRRAIGDTQGLTKLVTKEKVIILGIKNTGFGLFNGRNLNFLYDFSMKEKYPKYEAIGRVLNGLYIENAEASFPAEIEYILYSDVYSKENDSQTLTIDKNIKIYSNKTEGYWKEIENINKKIMIIDIDQNSMVKSIKEDKILQGKDIKGKFIILNGLEYNSDSNKPLIYMEV